MNNDDMNNSAKMTDRAKVLLEALPFIQQFHDKIIVVKLGGRVISNEEMLNTLLQDIVLLNLFGMKMVVVHGGGPEISEEMRKSGVKPKFIEGLRVTDEKTMEILHEQLAGKINKQIVLGINHHGGKAFGISGMDGNLIRARKLIYKTTTSKGKEVEIDLGLVGEVEKIDGNYSQLSQGRLYPRDRPHRHRCRGTQPQHQRRHGGR